MQFIIIYILLELQHTVAPPVHLNLNLGQYTFATTQFGRHRMRHRAIRSAKNNTRVADLLTYPVGRQNHLWRNRFPRSSGMIRFTFYCIIQIAKEQHEHVFNRLDSLNQWGLYYSHITQTDGRPTVGEPKMGKSGDVSRLSADVGTDFGKFFGRPTTFLSKHPS